MHSRSRARLNPAFQTQASFRESIWEVMPETDGKNLRSASRRLETYHSLESIVSAEERSCKGGEEGDSESVQIDEDHARKGWLADCCTCLGFGKQARCEQESDIWKMISCTGRALHPNSHSLLRWNIILMSLYLYTASVTPTEVAFVESSEPPLVLILLNFCVDMGYMFDILLTMNTGYFLRPSELEMSLKKIRVRYLSSWFMFDLVTGFPFQMMRLAFNADYPSEIGKTLKMLRLMKMLRVLAMSHVMKKLEARNDINFSYLRLFKLAISSLFIMHWLACGFYLLGQSETDDDCLLNGCSWTSFYQLDNQDFNTQYSTALYWAIMTFCTIGYGDIVPQTNVERWYVNFSMFVGVGFYSYMIGAVLGVMADFSEESTKYKGLMDELNRFMRDTGMPLGLRARLREFFRLKSSMQSIRRDMPLLTLLSPVLRDEVTTVLLSKTLMNTPLFRNLESLSNKKGHQTFSTQLAKVVVEEMFGPLEDVCLRGQEGQEAAKMYFIRHGVVCTRGTVVTHGGFFGDDMLYSKSFRRYRARTLTFTVTHSVTYSQMMKVLDHFVNEGKVVRFRLFKMLMRERLKNLTKHVRNSRSNTIAEATPSRTPQRQKRSLWDHVFLTYDEKAQIDSVVKSLDTWRAGEIIGSYLCNWMRRRGFQQTIDKDKAIEQNLLQQIGKVQRRIGDVASKSAPTSTLARPGVRYSTVDTHRLSTTFSSGRGSEKREDDQWFESGEKKTERFRFRGIQGHNEIEITHALPDSQSHRQIENISTAGYRQENTDEGNTPLHKEMFAMNFLVLKKIEELNEKIDRNHTEMLVGRKNVQSQIAAMAQMLDRKPSSRAI
eukprot:CAMPEP_0198216262 /NCGR_PEP_ID=MMETSP1445-20131203/56260_1 /TAXON_ID=36898 /ORGANISM="Pyramimonas sp., Strain CCMP2087" /LENGTH=832 /DNA_ID=CAMNT_0043892411 /DNA_START=654 /DNA_END=3155 /DNA_ORIENTATION=+